jgi:hypothetical protein
MNRDFSFKKSFGISEASIKIAEDICFRDLDAYTQNGLKQKLSEVHKSDTIEETMFFYPLNGMLNALSVAIHDRKM